MSEHFNKISGRALKMLAATAIIISFTVLYKEDSHAAAFTHAHDNSCYSTSTQTCSNHYISTDRGTLQLHCNSCGTTRTFENIVYWDNCRNGLVSRKDVAYKQTCSVCGAHRRYEEPGTDSHSYSVTNLVCGKDNNTVIANIALSPASTAPTNSDVTLNVSVSDAASEFSLAENPYNFGTGATSDSSFAVKENGTYNATVTDSKGRTVTVSCTVDFIDKANPVIDSISKSTEDWTESGVTVTVAAHDEGLGLADAPFSFDGGAFGTAASYHVSANGTVSVRVMDKAGNISESAITIANVGRDPKVIEAERREAERIAAEKEAARKAEEERIAAEKAAAEKAAQDKAAKDKAAKANTSKTASTSEKTKTSTKTGDKSGAKTTAKTTGKENAGVSVLGEFKDEAAGSAVAGGALGFETAGKLISVKDVTKADRNVTKSGKDAAKSESGITGAEKDFSKSETTPVAETYGETVIESVNEFSDTYDAYDTSEYDFGDSNRESTILKASVGDYAVIAGVLLLLLGSFIISCFNYVYVMQGGKKHPVCRCRVLRSPEGLVALVRKDKLTGHGKYLLYISPWKRGFKKKVPVSVMIEGEETSIPTDEGIAFKY